MTALILDYRRWHAARERRACRERAAQRAEQLVQTQRKRFTLDELLGPAFDPNGGAA